MTTIDEPTRNRLLGLFVAEAEECLAALLELAGRFRDREDPAAILEFKQTAHSLKGAAAAVGLPELVWCIHRIEVLGPSVGDLQGGIDFYSKLLGFRITDTRDLKKIPGREEMAKRLEDGRIVFMSHNSDHHAFLLAHKSLGAIFGVSGAVCSSGFMSAASLADGVPRSRLWASYCRIEIDGEIVQAGDTCAAFACSSPSQSGRKPHLPHRRSTARRCRGRAPGCCRRWGSATAAICSGRLSSLRRARSPGFSRSLVVPFQSRELAVRQRKAGRVCQS